MFGLLKTLAKFAFGLRSGARKGEPKEYVIKGSAAGKLVPLNVPDADSDQIIAAIYAGTFFDDSKVRELPAKLNVCFTGEFESETRQACEMAAKSVGFEVHKQVTSGTDVLVVGNNGSLAWSRKFYGNKIIAAFSARMRNQPIKILSEQAWKKLITNRTPK